MAQTLSTVGLLMAGATSISNVIKDISAKKVVDHHELFASTFWIRLFAAITFLLALGARAMMGMTPHFRNDVMRGPPSRLVDDDDAGGNFSVHSGYFAYGAADWGFIHLGIVNGIGKGDCSASDRLVPVG